MEWPAATTLLESKLHWMARKLRKIDEPSDITAWTDAMEGVLKIYNTYMKISALSKPKPKHNSVSIFKETDRDLTNNVVIKDGIKTSPLPPAILSPKFDVAHPPPTSCGINQEPLTQINHGYQPTAFQDHNLPWSANPRNTFTATSTRLCKACNNHLGYFYRNEAVNKACAYCKRSTKDPAGPSNLWDCSNCGYISCNACLRKTETLYILKKHPRSGPG